MPLLKIVKGEFVETLTYSARCSSEKIEAAGFTFKYPAVSEALAALI
jgi:NAD dependent epimerase/dehydratase family enzyme